MDTTIESNLDETLNNDEYDEPVWKSRNHGQQNRVSYSRKNAKKFLDKNLAEQNRDLYLELFDQDPDDTVCDNGEFEKELFSDLKKSQETLPEKPTAIQSPTIKKRKASKKKRNDENPDFMSEEYQRNLAKKKAKLEELFEKSAVYQNLQALKDMPLNIEEVDLRGRTVKRYEYYFDYELNKHDIVEVKNQSDDDESSLNELDENSIVESKTDPQKSKVSKNASSKDQTREVVAKVSARRNTRKRQHSNDELNDNNDQTKKAPKSANKRKRTSKTSKAT